MSQHSTARLFRHSHPASGPQGNRDTDSTKRSQFPFRQVADACLAGRESAAPVELASFGARVAPGGVPLAGLGGYTDVP